MSNLPARAFGPAPPPAGDRVLRLSHPLLIHFPISDDLAAVGPGQWAMARAAAPEIYELRSMINKKALPDGRPCEAFHVVFHDKAMAEREKRPLLDLGVQVFYEDERGERVEIVEETG